MQGILDRSNHRANSTAEVNEEGRTVEELARKSRRFRCICVFIFVVVATTAGSSSS